MSKFGIACFLVMLSAYLIGAVNFGVIISRGIYHDDVRTHGSGSAGMTNMIRNYGKAAGAMTAAGDVSKGIVAALLGIFIFSALGTPFENVCGGYLAGIFAVIGHMFPVYFGFKGGKGVLCAAGAIIATQPVIVAALLVVFLIQFFITRIVSLGSVIVAAAYPVCTFALGVWFGYPAPTLAFCTVCAFVMACLVIWMHRGNIERLRSGTEYRFGRKKS